MNWYQGREIIALSNSEEDAISGDNDDDDNDNEDDGDGNCSANTEFNWFEKISDVDR